MRRFKRLVYAWVSRKYLAGCSNYNSLEVRRGCRTKLQGRSVFAKNRIPHAPGQVFFWPGTARKFAREHGFPLVIKPNVSGFSRGSYFPIHSMRELYRAIFWAKCWWPTTVVERYLSGANYRVLAGRDGIVSAIRRYPPTVAGNGIDSIGALIDAENRIRADMGLHPVMYPAQKSGKVLRHLARQGMNFASIPEKGQRVELFHRVALSTGGVVETIDKSRVHEDNRRLFVEIVELFDANLLGIDAIFEKGIDIAHTEQECIVLEVNSRPYIKMHHYPRWGEKEDFSADLSKLDELVIEDRDIY